MIFPNFVFVNLDSSLFYLYRPVQTFISNHSHIWLCVIAHGKKSFHCNAKEFGKVHNCSEINRSQQWKIVLTNTLQIVYILVFINLHEVKKKLKQLFYVECHVIPHVWSRYTISHKIAVNHFVFFADRCLFLFPKLTKKKDVFKWTNRYHFIQNEKKTHTKYIFIILISKISNNKIV